MYVLWIVICPFDLFLLAIVLSVFLRFMFVCFMFVNYIVIHKYNFKTNLILQVIMTITAIKTTPPTVTPHIRPTKNNNVELRVPDNE